MAEVIFHVANPPATTQNHVHVVLYDGPSEHGFPRVGGPVKKQVSRLGAPVPTRAFDLLTLALAVTAADTFINRQTHSDTGWSRELRLRIPLVEPAFWDATLPVFEEALNFLTGDRWTLNVTEGGVPPPKPMSRGKLVEFETADRVCLFSGGLDSTIGVLDIADEGGSSLLVSHSYRRDKGKQEHLQMQALPGSPRFAILANPTCGKGMHPDRAGNDITMRGRSFNFLAAAVVAASVLRDKLGRQVPIVVPENGFIAINAPLTSRRLGSLSTRTTHPHFLSLMRRALTLLGLPADITNPYEFHTKGQMLASRRDQAGIAELAGETVSCGKWKRKGVQCGRCVPCIIRRASFHAAGMTDETMPFYTYDQPVEILESNDRDNLLALGRAARWTPAELSQAVGASGPLPPDPAVRARYERVVREGLGEVRDYLAASGVAM